MNTESTTPPAISTEELRDAVGVPASGDASGAKLYGAVAGALRFFDGVQFEVKTLLQERALLKSGAMPAKSYARRGLLGPDGAVNREAVGKRVAEIDAAIAHVYSEVQVSTAKPGFDRALAGSRWESGTLPTAAQLEQFLNLRDAWDSSQPFPTTLQEWGDALSLVSPTKQTVLAELSRRTKDRRARIEAKYAADLAALIDLTAARVLTLVVAHQEGQLPSAQLQAFGANLSASWAVIAARTGGTSSPLLTLSAASGGGKQFGMGEPLVMEVSRFPDLARLVK